MTQSSGVVLSQHQKERRTLVWLPFVWRVFVDENQKLVSQGAAATHLSCGLPRM